ncbi:uncharacterized protein LOC111342028 isoform X1 [Stylophora pistillata]|uniref:uncharacterized protein LOC111342028 isoform X1 n=1 Tax=Stylophora pistillata TaxID=50429 RepID=UPI000C05524F|nr:uncharacterized protein LOC111342028 isoform X1 [Stylophora pistillata]
MESDELPVVKEGDNMVGVIAGVLGVLILIVIAIIASHLYQRSNRPPNANLNVESQKKEFEVRRSNARVTAVESDQTQENLTLVPVGVTTQLTVSESTERRNLETEKSSLVYEEIDPSSPGVMVLSCFWVIVLGRSFNLAKNDAYHKLFRDVLLNCWQRVGGVFVNSRGSVINITMEGW